MVGPGDSNLDGEFNTGDLVSVFQAGHYEDAVVMNSGWSEGDWNGDGEFNSSDLTLAFQDGDFENGRRAQMRPIPEPSAFRLIALSSHFSIWQDSGPNNPILRMSSSIMSGQKLLSNACRNNLCRIYVPFVGVSVDDRPRQPVGNHIVRRLFSLVALTFASHCQAAHADEARVKNYLVLPVRTDYQRASLFSKATAYGLINSSAPS